MATKAFVNLTGLLLLNQQIPNTRYGTGSATSLDAPFHPHLIDIYEPATSFDTVVCALHGGNGSKTNFAGALGIALTKPPTKKTVNWSLLAQPTNNCAVWFPQGQWLNDSNKLQPDGSANPWNPRGVSTVTPDNPGGTPTWSNHDFWSGVDDPQFLKDVLVAISARYGSIRKVLAGHSEGGMMTLRQWSEHVAGGFDVYCCNSACRSQYYIDNPLTPAIVKPVYNEVGLLDTNLQIYPGHMYDPIWYSSPDTISVAGAYWPNPNQRIGDFYDLQTRVDAFNAYVGNPAQTVNVADGVTSAINMGTITRFTYAGGNMRLQIGSAMSHPVKSHQQARGRHLLSIWMTFARAVS